MSEGTGVRFRCATCDMELERPGFFYLGLAFCCPGCAADGPCACSYDEDPGTEVPGITHAVPGSARRARPRLLMTEPAQAAASSEDSVDGLGLPFAPIVAPSIEPVVVREPQRHLDAAGSAPARSGGRPSQLRPELARAAAD